jgi:hypothetical protein
MRRAAQANWSRLPNHNPPRFYTAWVIRVGFVMSVVCPVHPQQQKFSGPVGTSHLGHKQTSREASRYSAKSRPTNRVIQSVVSPEQFAADGKGRRAKDAE